MNSTDLAKCYNNHNYFNYPEMGKLIKNAIKHPESPIEIPSNLFDIPKKGPLSKTIIKICHIVCSVWKTIIFRLNPGIRTKFNRAVVRIVDAYKQKLDQIEKIKVEACSIFEEKKVIKEVVEDLKKRKLSLQNELKDKEEALDNCLAAKDGLLKKANDYKEANKGGFRGFWNWGTGHTDNKKQELLDDCPEFPLDNIDRALKELEDEILDTPVIHNVKLAKEEKSRVDQDLSVIASKESECATRLSNLESKAKELKGKFEASPFLIDKCAEEEALIDEFLNNSEAEALGKAPEAQELHKPYSDWIESVGNFTQSKDVTALWKALFFRFDEGKKIESFTCDAKGNFTLKVTEPLSIWLPSHTASDPHGGSIFLFGHNKNHILTGKLKPNTVEFTNGAGSHVDTQAIGVKTTKFKRMEFISRSDVRMHGSARVPIIGEQSGHKVKTYGALMKDWSENGKVLKSNANYEAYLTKKRKLPKIG